MKNTLCATLAVAIALAASPASANLANLHSQVKVGNKTCFAKHFHYMESGGFSTKAQAMAYGIKRWESYTRNEYGQTWASYKLAHEASVTCTESKGGRGTNTTCKIKAKPCRAGH